MKIFKLLLSFSLLISIMLTGCQEAVLQPSDDTPSEEMEEVTLRMIGPNSESEYELAQQSLEKFTAETGIKVELIAGAESATDRLTEYLVELGNGSSEIDVYQIDVIWPGILADHMIDLNEYLAEEAGGHFETIIQNNTVNGRLVGMPWYTDAGLLYYRADLLEKYGFEGPPETWDELEAMAQRIQEGERSEGQEELWGYVWQGSNYEGLTCNALEWQVSHGGGQIIEADGTISLNNPQAVKAFERAASWVGEISPPQVTQYLEEDARLVWNRGQAVFMRNWPYAYALSQVDGSAVKDKFEVTLLPDGGGGHAATLGGWQLAVSAYSRHPQEAVALVRYLTSMETQKERAIEGSFAPTIAELYDDEDVVQANPYYETLKDIFLGGAVARPSTASGKVYAEVSHDYFTAIHSILTGDTSAAQTLAELEERWADMTFAEVAVR